MNLNIEIKGYTDFISYFTQITTHRNIARDYSAKAWQHNEILKPDSYPLIFQFKDT